MKNLYLISGHQIINGKGNGAFGVDGFDEAFECRILVQDIIRYMTYGNQVPSNRILTDNDGWSLSNVINWIGKKLTKDCFTVDVHFNAFHTPKATGAEVLVANVHTEKEMDVARAISGIISKSLGIKNRGVKLESQSHRGYLGMLSSSHISKAKNVLLEICFCTNPGDVEAYRKNYPELVSGLANYLTKILNE